MQDHELYFYLLGLKSPWAVEKVSLDIKKRRVDVWVEHPSGETWQCPKCEKVQPIYDHAEERTWRHLDSCQCQTHLHARIPRVNCPAHGVRQVTVPWAEGNSRFTLLFERMAINVLLECSVSGASKLLGISWEEARHVMKRAVVRGLARKKKKPIRRICVDEKAAAKGHKYLTIIGDLEKGVVDEVTEGHTQESLERYYDGKTPKELEAVEAVSMDMWSPYVAATMAKIPGAEEKIVFDRFHVMAYVNDAVDQVRREENLELMKAGDDTLKKTRYLWIYGRENVPQSRRMEFSELKRMDLKVSRAWAIKERFRDMWGYVSEMVAWKFWKRWYFWATHSRLKAIQAAAKTVKNHITGVMNYFKHRVTNATAESINSKIQKIKQMACGFRNTDSFKTAIYFHCGGLDLYPC